MREKQSVLQIFKSAEYLIIKGELRHFGSLMRQNNAQNRTITPRSKLYSLDNIDVNLFLSIYQPFITKFANFNLNLFLWLNNSQTAQVWFDNVFCMSKQC